MRQCMHDNSGTCTYLKSNPRECMFASNQIECWMYKYQDIETGNIITRHDLYLIAPKIFEVKY